MLAAGGEELGPAPGDPQAVASAREPRITDAELEKWLDSLWPLVSSHYIMSEVYRSDKHKLKTIVKEALDPYVAMRGVEDAFLLSHDAYYAGVCHGTEASGAIDR